VIHVYLPEIAQQRIGLSALLAALPLLYDIEMLLQNQVLTSRVAAGLLMWLKKSGADTFSVKDDILPMSPLNIIRSEDKPEAIQGSSKVAMEVIPLIKQCLQAIAASLGVSYSAISRDLNGESFSGGRLRNMMDLQSTDMLYKFFCKSALLPVYEWAIEDAISTRLIKSVNIDTYNKDRRAYNQCYFSRQPQDYIDPLDNTRNIVEKINANLMTLKTYYEEQGLDWVEQLQQRALEIKMQKDLGITTAEAVTVAKSETKSDTERKKEKNNESNPVIIE
jgi:capsid protein